MHELPIPPHFAPARVGEVWRVPYQERAAEAAAWARAHGVRPAAEDRLRICLVAVDVQNTFCIPGFELFVGGRSGTGAVDDNRRLCAFLYRNLGAITRVIPTLDTHRAMQIFHPLWLVNGRGEHPAPFTLVTAEDVERGVWRFNAAVAPSLGLEPEDAQRQLRHYVRRLAEGGKYALTVWPYHAMLGGIGHALVPAVEEAVFFHAIARASQPDFQVKGDDPLTEHYSVIGPEVTLGAAGEALGARNRRAGGPSAPVRRGGDRGAGEEPLRRLDDRRPAGRGARARLLARAACVPARGLHLARGGARRDRLHRRGRRRLPALRRGRLPRRALDRSALDLARPGGAPRWLSRGMPCASG